MKKKFSSIAVAFLTMSMPTHLTGCSSSYVGKYKLVSIIETHEGGNAITYELGKRYKDVTYTEDDFVLTIKGDNTWNIQRDLHDGMGVETFGGTWKEKDGKPYLMAAGEKFFLERDGDKFFIKGFGDMYSVKIIFKKA